MQILGYACSIMFSIGLIISIARGYSGDYNKSRKAEVTCVLWLIAALICFK